MNRVIAQMLPFLLFTATLTFGQDSDAKAQQLAKDIWKASGGENWAKVKRLRFTFIVEQDGNRSRARSTTGTLPQERIT